MKKLPIIIDCDPGGDDAMTLLTLFKNKELFDIRYICSSAGNTPIDVTTNNVKFFASRFFNGVKVGRGVGKALKKVNPETAEDVFGVSGLGFYSIPQIDYLCDEDGIAGMRDAIVKSEEKITIIALGPHTNIAKLLQDYPEVKENIAEIYTMIGSIEGIGNVKPYSEFNAYFDPDAFKIVADSGIKLTINPMELGHNSRLKKSSFIDRTYSSDVQEMITKIIDGMYEFRDPTLVSLFDVHSLLAILHPEFYDFINCDVNVTLDGVSDGQCFLPNNPSSKHRYQVLKDADSCNEFILKELFSLSLDKPMF